MRKQRRVLKRALIPLLLLIAVSALSGCSGGARATAWTSLVVNDGVVYVADMEQVRALDAESGQVLWDFPNDSGGPFYTVTLLPDEALFVTSREKVGGGFFAQPQGVLRALSVAANESEGRRVLWPFTGAEGDYVGGGAVGNGILVIGNGDGKVYAFNVENGSPAWDQPFATGDRVWATPLIISDTVYVASLDHRLYALDLETGTERWERPFEAGGAMADRPLAFGDCLYIGAFDHKLYAIRQEDGAVVWEFEGANWFWGTPATDGTFIYAADVDGNVYAVDAETGERQWQEQVGELVRLGPLLNQDGDILLVAGNYGTLYALDTSDGFGLWSEPGEGQLASIVVSGELIYVTRILATERVQAFYVENGRHLWTFPPSESE